MDSLRYWVTEMRVDGFRFDLTASLARELHAVSKLSAFFDIIHQDPVLSQVKLIAEPWDVGEGGYQVGNFPVLWAEWNGKYRDSVRSYWKGDEGQAGEIAHRLTGSPDPTRGRVSGRSESSCFLGRIPNWRSLFLFVAFEARRAIAGPRGVTEKARTKTWPIRPARGKKERIRVRRLDPNYHLKFRF
jgi:hypothetical protein